MFEAQIMGYRVLASSMNNIPIIPVKNIKFHIFTRLAMPASAVGPLLQISFESRLVCTKAQPFEIYATYC